MVTWSEDELRRRGYVETADGSYTKVGERNIFPCSRNQDSREVSQPEPSVLPEEKRSDEIKERAKRSSKGGDQFTIIVDSYRKRYMDPDNLCPKWYIDEIVKAGIIPDDSSRYVKEVKKRVHVVKDEEFTRITIVKHDKIRD